MKEHRITRIELLKNMIFNLILFTIVFGIFSLFIWAQVGSYLYKSADRELLQYKKQLEDSSKYAIISEETKNFSELTDEEIQENLTDEFQFNLDRIANPRIVAILRNEEGKVLATSIRVKSFAEFLDRSNFDSNIIDRIYEISINSKYYYRGITSELTSSNNDKYYVDILININSEKEMMQSFTKTLIIGTGTVIILSIFISFYLSKRALNPIINAYKKQAEFVQNASHELRTPLTIIQAKQEMLLQSPESKIIDKSADIALTLNETRRLSKMVKELMDLARADENKTVLNKSQTELNELIREVSIPYEEMAKIQKKEMILELNCTKKANVDKNKIKQLMIILLDNALKYTEEKSTIKVVAKNQEDKFVISVIDTGIGISDEALKHVFERFYREDRARSREKGGSGLGLSIAYTIVKSHGGNIKISHNKPKGTVITVKL